MYSKNTTELIQLLGNLTFFPQNEICNQLDERSLLLVSLFSEKWEQFVRNYRRTKRGFVWDITLSKNILMLYLTFDDEKKKKRKKKKKKKKKNFQIGFKEDPNSSKDFYFEHDTRWNSTTLHFKTAHQLETFSFKALELICHLFAPTSYHSYHRITVPLGPRCPDFPFQFLSKLPFGIARYVDLQADQEVECADLVKFLQNVKLGYGTRGLKTRLTIRLRMKNVVPCDEITIHGVDLNMADARFMTQESLRKLDVFRGEIGENNFTSQDFNEYFRAWTRGWNLYKLNNISFAIRKDQKINIEEVLEGLNVHVGERRIRDRWFLRFYPGQRGYLSPTAVDCAQAHTILKLNGFVGAILFEPNRLSFYNFSSSVNWFIYDAYVDSSIYGFCCYIRWAETEQERLEKKISVQGVNAKAKDLQKLAHCLDQIESMQQRVKEALEVELKLDSVWRNDDDVEE